MSRPAQNADANSIDLIKVLNQLWLKKWLIIFFAAFGFLLGVIYLHESTPTYTAVLKVTPAASSAGSMPSKMGGLSGLAAIAGISSLGSNGATPFELYMDALVSRDVAAELAREPKIMHTAFPAEWNVATKTWREPQGTLRRVSKSVKDTLGFPAVKWRAPDAARLQDYINSSVIIVQDEKGPITKIQFDHRYPEFAAYFLTRLNAAADLHVRRRALEQGTRYAEYLSRRLATTVVAEHRQTLSTALGEQERMVMMASSGVPYAANPLGSTLVSDAPTKPKPGLALVAATLGFAFIGIFISLFDFFGVTRLVVSGDAERADDV